MKKILSLAIVTVFLVSNLTSCCCFFPCGNGLLDGEEIFDFDDDIRFETYISSDEISSVIGDMRRTDSLCESAYQQSQNGADACYELVKIIAKGLGVSSDDISYVQSQKIIGSSSSNSAIQEQVISTYRTFDLLVLIAEKLDEDGEYAYDISSIESTFRSQDNNASGAPQQLVNGLYRSVEILEVIAKIADEDNNYSTEIYSTLNRLYTQNDSCKSAPQQSANGAYRCVEMVLLIAEILDYDGDFQYDIDYVSSTLDSNNDRCTSALQQNANGVYRMAEALEVLANVLNS